MDESEDNFSYDSSLPSPPPIIALFICYIECIYILLVHLFVYLVELISHASYKQVQGRLQY